MFPYSQLLVSALLGVTALAAPAQPGGVLRPIVNAGVSKVFDPNDLTELVKADYARAQAAKSGSLAGDLGGSMSSFASTSAKNATSAKAVGSAHATNRAIYYTVATQIGSPSVNYQLLIDTGSANTWVGAKTPFVKTSTSVNTGARMVVNYQASQMQGNLYYDKVAVSSTISVSSQAIGVATSQRGFSGVDGVLGLGPKRLTRGTTSQGATVEYPTFTDTLWQKGVITNNQVSISFAPTNAVGTINGQLTLGGVDSTRYNSALKYVPLTTKWPASSYWGLDVASVNYGSTKLFTSTATPAIVESGLTLLYLSSDAYAAYVKATGAVMDTKTGLLKITTAQLNALKPLDFTIGGVKYSFTANAQLWPRSLNGAIGGTSNTIYLAIANLGTKSGSGLDIILGQVFMERFYTTFDTTNKRIGLATTVYTNSTIN